MKARFSTVSSHPTEFKVAKHDFIIHDQIICLDILDVANKVNEIHLFFSPPPGSLFVPGLSEKQVIDLVWP